MGRHVGVEVYTPMGRVDMVMRTDLILYLCELKHNKSAEAAMRQIDLKDYASRFALSCLSSKSQSTSMATGAPSGSGR